MNPDQSADLARRNAIAWDRTATKYAAEIDADVALVRGGGTNLLPPELRVLGPPAPAGRSRPFTCSVRMVSIHC